MLFSEVDWVTIYQGRGMSWWQLSTFIICVGFWSCDVLDLEMCFFGGWLGDFHNLIFVKATKIVLYDNPPGVGH